MRKILTGAKLLLMSIDCVHTFEPHRGGSNEYSVYVLQQK